MKTDASAPAGPEDSLDAELLVPLGVTRAYPKKTIVFQEGDPSSQIYVIVSGRVEVFLSSGDGRQITLDTLEAGQFFGEMSLDGQPRSASVITLAPSRLSVIQKDAFRAFLASHPDAAFALLTTVIRRARNLTGVAGSLALLDVYGRVARTLLIAARVENGQLLIPERLTHGELATRAGTTREMVTRILSHMRANALIGTEGERIVLHEALRERL